MDFGFPKEHTLDDQSSRNIIMKLKLNIVKQVKTRQDSTADSSKKILLIDGGGETMNIIFFSDLGSQVDKMSALKMFFKAYHFCFGCLNIPLGTYLTGRPAGLQESQTTVLHELGLCCPNCSCHAAFPISKCKFKSTQYIRKIKRKVLVMVNLSK